MVSFLIMCYNNLDGAYGTLDSVFRQDYPEIEIVLSDDASRDYAEKQPALAEYIRLHRTPNIRQVRWVSHEENVGTVRNTNDAIRASQGEYIMALASEDVLATPQALSHLVKALEETGREICFGRLRGVTPEGRRVEHLLSCESDYDLLKSYTVEQTRNRLFSRNFLPAPTAMKTRRLFEENGLYPEEIRLIEDYPYWLTLTKNGVPFAYLDEVVVEYELSGVSSAGSYSEMFMKDMYVIYDHYIFPYDHRLGAFQGIYNRLKRHGLDFYMAKARWPKMSAGRKIWCRVRYLPFFVYTGLLNWNVARKNLSPGGK